MTERRACSRYACQAGIRLFHPASGREIPVRVVNVSRGGVAALAPPYAPIRPGHAVRLLDLPALEGGTGTGDGPVPDLPAPVQAIAVRVDRAPLLTTGQILLALRFSEPDKMS
jgi:hypothetical protein